MSILIQIVLLVLNCFIPDPLFLIDEMALASERAENIKKGLIERGVAQNILITVPIGRTTRWGEERKLNRAVTIESVAE